MNRGRPARWTRERRERLIGLVVAACRRAIVALVAVLLALALAAAPASADDGPSAPPPPTGPVDPPKAPPQPTPPPTAPPAPPVAPPPATPPAPPVAPPPTAQPPSPPTGPSVPPPAPPATPPAPAPAAPDAPAEPPPPQGTALERARKAVESKQYAAALALYFAAIRECDDYETKYKIRDEVLALPPIPAPKLSDRERMVVAARVAEERGRDVDVKAGRMEGRGALRGAMALWRKLYDLDGVADDKKRQIEATLERLAHFLCDEATDEEKAKAKELQGDPKDPAAAFARAEKAAAEGLGRVALKVYAYVSFSSFASGELRDKAREAIAALRKAMCEYVPPEEAAEVEKVWNDPHWSYLGTSASWQWIFIGAKDFVEAISDADRVRVDLALVLLGDFVGRDLVDESGARLTIYYKERFDFGGGLGGGYRIDIGNKVIARPIANGLHWHEMSHCVFDVAIIYPGFTEGIANFGATFCHDAMGSPAECDASIASNRKGYREDYLERRIKYWRIAPYAPSCGFFLTPISALDPVARRAQWQKYREFFRRLRDGMPRDPRDAERIRYFAWFWGKVFGWSLLDESAKARFPVVPEDQERVLKELPDLFAATDRAEQFAEGDLPVAAKEAIDEVLGACPPGELVDRCKFAKARVLEGEGDEAGRDRLYKELGVVPSWKLCLPFYSRWMQPLLAVFPPEREIVLAAEYPNPNQTSHWVDAKTAKDGRVNLLEHGVGYPDDAAAYALAYLEAPTDVPDAVVYLGFDDFGAVWINGELAEKWEDGTSWIRDHHVASIPLKAGTNRLLLKIVNRTGEWGFSARVVHANRTPIEGLVFTKKFPPQDVVPVAKEPKGQAVYTFEPAKGKTLPKGKFRATVGAWDLGTLGLHVTNGGNVGWRKYVISPFVTKDPPIALLWLTDKELAGLADFAVEVTVHGRGAPHVAVTLHGEEKDDGMSGHTFVVSGGGEGVDIRLDEYERPVYRGTGPVGAGDDHVLRFVRRGRALSCQVDGAPILSNVDLPALPKSGIGLMVWNKSTEIVRVRVERLGK